MHEQISTIHCWIRFDKKKKEQYDVVHAIELLHFNLKKRKKITSLWPIFCVSMSHVISMQRTPDYSCLLQKFHPMILKVEPAVYILAHIW